MAQDGTPYGTRYGKVLPCFAGVPAKVVRSILRAELEKHLPLVVEWDARYLLRHGEKVILGG